MVLILTNNSKDIFEAQVLAYYLKFSLNSNNFILKACICANCHNDRLEELQVINENRNFKDNWMLVSFIKEHAKEKCKMLLFFDFSVKLTEKSN